MVTVRVLVTLKPSLLDSAGHTVASSLQKLGFQEVEDTRIGKLIELKLKDFSESRVKDMCDKLLSNPVIENYRYEVVESAPHASTAGAVEASGASTHGGAEASQP